MKPNSSTANRTSVRVQSSPRSHRSAAASRGSETLCRPSLPTAEAGTAACAATAKCATASAKWCADSANAPTAVNHSPAAHERKDLPRARRFSSAKASRHGARAKGFAPRRNTPLGESLPTRRTGEGICPAGFAFAPRADERRAALGRRTARKTPLRRGRTHSARPLPSSFTEKNKTTP